MKYCGIKIIVYKSLIISRFFSLVLIPKSRITKSKGVLCIWYNMAKLPSKKTWVDFSQLSFHF